MLVVVSSTGRACPACLGPGVPKLTLVQRLADCDQIIVAKATLQQPEYVTIETVIRGELRAGSILEIPRGERRPLYVLLLGIRGGDEFDDCIDEQLSLLHRNHETQGLAAWWVAKLERTGPAGLEELQQRYLADSQRSEEERLAVCLALSVQGSGNRERFREPVVAIYRELIETGTVNTVIVTDLTLWSRRELEPLMRRMLERSDLANPLREAIHSYLLASSK